jgi:diaminopimelate epimerase
MPVPLSITTMDETPVAMLNGASLVDLGGIMHVILMDIPANQENFDLIKYYINETYNPPAMGVMFYDTEKNQLTPVVYVRDVDTTYFEGSCGSGSTAVAAAFSAEEKSGIFQFEINQPAGMIISTIEKAHGAIKNVWIQGPVTLSEVKAVTIDVPEQ